MKDLFKAYFITTLEQTSLVALKAVNRCDISEANRSVLNVLLLLLLSIRFRLLVACRTVAVGCSIGDLACAER